MFNYKINIYSFNIYNSYILSMKLLIFKSDGQEYKTKGSFIKHVQRMEHTNSHQHNHDPINSTSNFLPVSNF